MMQTEQQRTQLAVLQDIFKHSHQYVWIADLSCQVLWCSHDSLPGAFRDLDIGKLLRSHRGMRLCSGRYTCTLDGLTYSYSLLRYPDPEDQAKDLLVIQMAGEDVFAAFLHDGMIREFLENQSGTIRQAVSGITAVSGQLAQRLRINQDEPARELLNVGISNCFRLLRSTAHTTELLRYAEAPVQRVRIDVCAFLQEFAQACTELLQEHMQVTLEDTEPVYIVSDPERFSACIQSMLLLSCGSGPCASLRIRAVCQREQLCISMLPAEVDAPEKPAHRVRHDKLEPLHPGNPLDSEAYLIRRYCSVFGGTLEQGEAGWQLRLPLASSEDAELLACCSPKLDYAGNRFSRLQINLSQIAEFDFY